MPRKRKPLSQRVQALKDRQDRRYYELSLRDDLAQLIAVGMSKNPGMTQRDLTGIAGWKSESYVSRLIHAEANCKLGAIARVLIPLGIVPILVDKNEWDHLKSLEENQTEQIGAITDAIALQSRELSTSTFREHSDSGWGVTEPVPDSSENGFDDVVGGSGGIVATTEQNDWTGDSSIFDVYSRSARTFTFRVGRGLQSSDVV